MKQGHIADAGKMVEMASALRWTAAALQAQRHEQDTVTIDGETRTIGQILDDANIALEVGEMS